MDKKVKPKNPNVKKMMLMSENKKRLSVINEAGGSNSPEAPLSDDS